MLLLFAGAPLQPIDEPGYRALISASKNKTLLVDFWASWCEPCRAELPELASLQRRLRSRSFRLATVSTDDPEQERTARRLLGAAGIGAPAYIRRPGSSDGFINAIDPKWSGALPALFLYDRSGRLVRSFRGEVEMRSVEAAVRKLL